MVVNVVDDIAPKAVIHPFYWNSKEDGSFCYDEDGVALGHIDIDDGTGTKNPGVSGKVWIKATVTDETRLSSATLKLPNGTDFGTVATYTGGIWVEASSLPANVKAVEFLDTPEPNQSGHSMTFRVAVDMTSYGLARNMTVDVGATDKEGTESAADSVQTIDSEKTVLQATQQTIDPDKTIYGQTKDEKGKLTSHYIMDFVPYIKSIYPATESSASRSRLGKFPVQAGKEMIIEGMNFAKTSTYKVKFYKTNASATGDTDVQATTASETIEDASVTKVADGKIKVTAPDYSRYVEVEVTSGAVTLPTNIDLTVRLTKIKVLPRQTMPEPTSGLTTGISRFGMLIRTLQEVLILTVVLSRRFVLEIHIILLEKSVLKVKEALLNSQRIHWKTNTMVLFLQMT